MDNFMINYLLSIDATKYLKQEKFRILSHINQKNDVWGRGLAQWTANVRWHR